MYFCVDSSNVGGLANAILRFSGGAWLLYDDGPPPRRMEPLLVLGDVKIRMNEGNEGISGRIRELKTSISERVANVEPKLQIAWVIGSPWMAVSFQLALYIRAEIHSFPIITTVKFTHFRSNGFGSGSIRLNFA